MAEGATRAGRWPGEAAPVATLFAFALVVHAGTAILGAHAAGIGLSPLGVYYDGHLYLEIAKSFPLPYSDEGPDYLGQAPGYPALIALARALAPAALDWGVLALATTWLAAALSAVLFYVLCRRLGVAPFWPGVAFAVANARWMQVAATAHPEPLALLCVLAAFLALLDARLGWCSAWLSLAGLTRFPALLLLLPAAVGTLVWRRARSPRAVLALAAPLVVLGLWHLYLAQRVPGFRNVAATHQVFWQTSFTWPFDALLRSALPWARSGNDLWFAVTYATLVAHGAALWMGLRARAWEERLLALWIAAVVGFHACLSGAPAAWDYTRLAILAWPPTLLLLWRRLAPRLPAAALVLGCAALGAYGVWTAQRAVRDAVVWQNQLFPFLAETVARLDADEPRWIRFSGGARGRP